MDKIKYVNLCNCMTKFLIIDFVREYKEGFALSNFASDVTEGQLCLVNDEIVDEGDYDLDGNYQVNFQVKKTLYPIEYCPCCGKRIEYKPIIDKSHILELK